jgi:cytochrome c553/mono/diheme cytochrome c family protein
MESAKTLLTMLGLAIAAGRSMPAEAAPVDFNREIRPILANHCLKCHGPDAGERKGGLRLDVREAAIAAADSGEKAIVPGKVDASELIKRINSGDADYHMPPADEKKPLSDEQKKLLARWIAEGADYQVHWAFVAPKLPAIPDVNRPAWTRNAIDRFILARLEQEGLTPSAEASRETLIRRLSLDLTGFPPTLTEIDAYLADTRPDAYERLVDRLVASPHFGERLAVDWLDAARFADTHGYHIDAGRDMTRWREYVIDSFNRNTPYDQFTIEQLAGDLLPSTGDAATDLRQKLASGFNRNHMINFEGGAIPEEYLNAYIIDRVNTTGTVFLGLTVACTQCHDHKYDPISQRDYYQLYAFFNNVPEQGLDGRKGNASPMIKVASLAQEQELATIAAEIAAAEKRLKEADSEIDREQAAWEKTAVAKQAERWLPLAVETAVARGKATLAQQEDKSILVSGENPATDAYELIIGETKDANFATAIRLEVLPHDALAGKGPGRSVNGNIVLTDVVAEIIPAANDAQPQSVKFKAASADFSQKDFPVDLAIDDKPATGWAIHPELGKKHAAVFEFASPLELADGAKLRVVLKFESQFGQHQPGLFRLSATRTTNPHAAGAFPDAVAAALAIPAAERTGDQSAAIRKHYREQVSPTLRLLNADLAALKMKQATLDSQIPTSMVMQDQSQPRDTFVLLRGAYDKKGDKVAAAFPSFLPPLADGLPNNRFGLARWLVDERHPLTGRVTVNRYWQLVFGTGLVKTAEDFGTQGELPSHPELLDWLAVEFRGHESGDRSQWDVKRLLRELVSSAAYRQSSAVTPELVAKDPENRLLARGPRFRLQAEFIRDQALFVSGLYDRRLGGKSVSPYQPTGLWEELMSRADGDNWTAQKYVQDHGADLYRRTMYTFWKRTCPPPSLATLDAPDRETCTVRRSRTNTPLQALVLMNDPTYVEGARKFAERVLREGGNTNDEKLAFAFRNVLSRLPSDAELAVLRRVLDRQLTAFRGDGDAVKKLLSIGESPADASLDAAELAAWTMVASAILNTDEAVTKG